MGEVDLRTIRDRPKIRGLDQPIAVHYVERANATRGKATTMPKLIKRYAQSRLYDTEAARYVTIADLREWQARGLAFTVVDAETNHDITTILLA
jgi:hypothetical protein